MVPATDILEPDVASGVVGGVSKSGTYPCGFVEGEDMCCTGKARVEEGRPPDG